MRVFTIFFVGAWILTSAGASLGLAPCPESCHLGQGQPLLLADADALLVTRCDRLNSNAGGTSTCVTERLDLTGKLEARLPRVPSSVGSDAEFTKEHLAGHVLVGLSWQEPWTMRTKPYKLNELFTHQQLTLSLAKSVLTCAAPGRATITRNFGCEPSDIHVFATMSIDKSPLRPVIVVGVCRPDANTEHEVVVACAASESRQ